VDEGSRLFPTQDPNVFSRTINYKLSYDDPAVVTETIASGPDQWGNSQTYFSTSHQIRFIVPGSQTLVSSANPQNFSIHYGPVGQYVASFNVVTKVLTIGSGSQDAGTDAGQDAAVDAHADAEASVDSSVDATTDTGADADAMAETGADVGVDVSVDVSVDVAVDVSIDVSADVSVDASVDVGVDAADAGVEASVDAGPDTGTDAGFEGGSWQPVATAPTFSTDTPLLLTDGRVAVHVPSSEAWWSLTPDIHGSYVNGTWQQLASLPSGYGPLYFGSAVLADGRLIVEGGEYNLGSQIWTNLGAIYDPVANAWTAVAPPSGWANIGDAESVVLANGTFMLSNAVSSQEALFNAATLTWTATGTGKADGNDEEGWTLLPNGRVLTVDAINVLGSELYNPDTGSWASAGSTIVSLVDVASEEIGPAVLQPNGVVFYTGGSGHTALYNTATGTWSAGPDFPVVATGQLDVADGPAALLPDGNVLVASSPGVFQSDTHFFEFDGAALHEVAKTPNASGESSFQLRMLVLPTGQILEIDGSTDVEIYTPAGGAIGSIAPAITSVASTLTRGSTFPIQGTQFNGVSLGASYGDDAQMATNYPLVRIQNNATGHIFYARTHGHSTMAVATGSTIVSTSFDVPAGAETGPSQIFVVANGVASSPVAVTVQ
jgi:hypothetical protein